MATDLHGMTVHTAWKYYRDVTQRCYQKNIKKITVITGHGIMSAEFQGWVSADPFASRCQRDNPNTGSWTVWIKKNSIAKKQHRQSEPVDLACLYKKFNTK